MWGYINKNFYIWGLTDVELLFYNRTNILILEEAIGGSHEPDNYSTLFTHHQPVI